MAVQQEIRGRVLLIHLEREDKRNAVNGAMAEGIDAALNRLDDDPELWAGVLTGTRTVFSAGTDIKEGSGPPTERGGDYGIIRRHRAARDSTFGLPESLRGLVATSGALFRAPRALPVNVARELLITGNTLTAERAFQLGVVNQVTEPGEALTAALPMAEKICASSPTSVRESLRAVRDLTTDGDVHGWEVTERAKAAITSSADMREGIDAFFENRPPRWTAR